MAWSGVMPSITTKFSNEDKLPITPFKNNLNHQFHKVFFIFAFQFCGRGGIGRHARLRI